MSTDELTESAANVVAALDVLLYGLEDDLSLMVDRLSSLADERVSSAAEPLATPMTRLLQAADVDLPGEGGESATSQSAARLLAELDSMLAVMDATNGAVVNRITDQVDNLIADVVPGVTELIVNVVQIMGQLVGGLLNQLVESDDFARALYLGVKDGVLDDFARLIDGIATVAKESANRVTTPTGPWLAYTKELFAIAVNPARRGSDTPGEIARRWQEIPLWQQAILNLVTSVAAVIAYANAAQAGGIASWAQASLINTTPSPLTPPQLASLLRRQQISEDFAETEAKRSGLSPELFGLLVKLTQSYLTADNYVSMWRRTGNDSELDELKNLGLADEDIARLRTLALAMPTPTDLIRFMVRDVFDPTAVAEGRLDDEFADKIDREWNRKVGVDDETMKLYWMAHWQLPSPTMLYNMYHRNVIDRERLVRGLKQADWAPGWIDPLIQIAYNVPGRIDVRRMYEAGIITTREELIRRHEDMGYSPDDAATLASFVERIVERQRQNEAERLHGPLMRQIINSYAEGGLAYDVAIGHITGLGFTQNEAEYRLQLGIFQREEDRSNRVRDAVRREFVQGFTDESGARAILGQYGFEVSAQDSLLDSWTLDRELRILTEERRAQRDLSKSEIIDSYSERLVDRRTAATWLGDAGYDEREAETLLSLEDAKLARADARAVEQAIRAQYLTLRIDAASAEAALRNVGLREERIGQLIARWTVEREERRPDISASQVERMLMQGVIPEEQAEQQLLRLGYDPGDAALLMTLYGTDMSIAQETLEERRRQFNIREERLARQGDRRLNLTERGQDIGVQRFQAQQQGIQTRFDASQAQTRELQTERLQAASAAQNQRIAAQTARDAEQFERSRIQQDRQIAAQAERLERQIAAQNERAAQSQQLARDLADKRATLAAQQRAAVDARQERQIAASIQRLDREIAAAESRQRTSVQAQRDLQAQRAEAQRELTQIRSELQAARDIRIEASRIAGETRAEQQRIRTEQRAEARSTIRASDVTANAAQLQALQFNQTAAVAEVNARFAALQAQIAESRQRAALDARQAAERALQQATPPSLLLET